jgi:hypothetical protein
LLVDVSSEEAKYEDTCAVARFGNFAFMRRREPRCGENCQ